MHDLKLAHVVANAYDAAFDDNLWGGWTRQITEVLGGVGGTFFVLNAENGVLENVVSSWGKTEELIPDYMQDWWQFDPQMPTACGLTQSEVYLDSDHVNLANPVTAEYMAWQRDKGGFDHHMSAVALLGDGQRRVGISIHRATGNGPTPDYEHQRLLAVFPEIARALRLGHRHGEILQDTFWNGLIVGRPDQIAFLIDERGRVIRHTDAAGVIIGSKSGVYVSQGKLRALNAADDSLLQAKIDRAINPIIPQSGAMRVTRPSGKARLVVICYPLPRSSRMLAPVQAAALVNVIDPSSRVTQPGDLYRQAFSLTSRETELAVALMQGHSVESAAAVMNLGMPTVRSHLRKLFAKTSESSQSSLMRLLAKFA